MKKGVLISLASLKGSLKGKFLLDVGWAESEFR